MSDEFLNVNKTKVPCQSCGTTTNYCWYIEDGSVYGCRAQDGPGGLRRMDKSGTEYWLFGTPSGKAKLDEIDEPQKTPTASVEERDRAYLGYLFGFDREGKHHDGLKLFAEHKDGLFDDAEALGYRSCPKGDLEELRAAARMYRAADAESPMDFLRIPGARIKKVKAEDGTEKTRAGVSSYSGTYIPVRDAERRIIALRVRKDDGSENKYVWFRGDDHGSAVGMVPHIASEARALREARGEPCESPARIVRITEGEKKADIATLKTPILTVGVPSAGAYALGFEALSDVWTTLKKDDAGCAIRVAYDTDAMKKRTVCQALTALVGLTWLRSGMTVELETWDPKCKGIDDALLGGAEIQVTSGVAMYETLVRYCISSGAPVPNGIQARADLFRLAQAIQVDAARVRDPKLAEALAVVEGDADCVATIETVYEVAASIRGKSTLQMAVKAERKRRKDETKKKDETDKKARAQHRAKALAKRAEAEGLPVFERGDHAEIADKLLEGLGPLKVYDEGSFYVFDETHWSKKEGHELGRVIKRYAGAPVGNQTLKIGMPTINGSLAMAEMEIKEPGFFESAPVGFAFQNGFVTVDRDGVHLQRHDPKQKARSIYDFDFDPDVRCPAYGEFLIDILRPEIEEGTLDSDQLKKLDEEIIQRVNYIEEFFGLCLVGKAPQLAGAALVLIGEGANGKSTLGEIIVSLFPPELVSAIAPHDWKNDQKAALLAGKLLNVVGELPGREMRDSEYFKSVVTGKEEITAKNVFERPFNFKPIAGHFLSANDFPASTDGSYGMARRFAVIPMHRVFLPKDQDRTLKEKILVERPGIIARLLKAAQRAIARGKICDLPSSSDDALDEWRTVSDAVRAYVLDRSEPRFKTQAHSTWTSDVELLYQDFRGWAPQKGRQVVSETTFRKRLQRVIVDLARRDLARGTQEQFFVGIDDKTLERLVRNDGVHRITLPTKASVRSAPLQLRETSAQKVEREVEEELLGVG